MDIHLGHNTDIGYTGSAAADHVAIVIPAYNEGATIGAIARAALLQTPNVIIVNDGSTDDTVSVLQGMADGSIDAQTAAQRMDAAITDVLG